MSARTATWTWAALCALTLLTWLLARNPALLTDALAVGALIALAGIKIYLILAVFMGVWRAPAIWHGVLILWIMLCLGFIAVLAARSLA